MDITGLQSELLPSDETLYNERTAQYIEYFYNNYTLNDGQLRGDVLDVVAMVNVTEQEIGDSSVVARSSWRHSNTAFAFDDETNVDKDRGNPDEEEVQQYHTEYTMDNSAFMSSKKEKKKKKKNEKFGSRGHHPQSKTTQKSSPQRAHSTSRGGKSRKLQIADDANCTGPTLSLVFTISLEYRLRGTNSSNLTLSEIINEPFSTAAHRDEYLNDFLKQSSDDGDDPFEDVTCTSEVDVPLDPGEGAPSMSPAPSSSFVPTASAVPTAIGNATMSPTLSDAPTITPDAGNGTEAGNVTNTMPTPSPTLSAQPSIFDDTANISLRMSFNGNNLMNDKYDVNERKCSEQDGGGILTALMQSSQEELAVEEFELSFVYGIEMTTAFDDILANNMIEDVEHLVFEFVARSILQCDIENIDGSSINNQHVAQEAVQLRTRTKVDHADVDERSGTSGVVRIRCPATDESGKNTSICKSLCNVSSFIFNIPLHKLAFPVTHFSSLSFIYTHCSKMQSKIISSKWMCSIKHDTSHYLH